MIDLTERKKSFEKRLEQFSAHFYHETPDQLHEAIKYALHGPGKRVRAILVQECAALFVKNAEEESLRAAFAVEMVHAYSLVHDDLPCMDDDALRRGRATCHVKFGEATALLAGDALLTDAFSVLTAEDNFLPAVQSPKLALAMVSVLAKACGCHGMVIGQALDLFWTKREGATREQLLDIHGRKTGDLIAAACTLGALSGGAEEKDLEACREFGKELGLAFQIADDLIDENSGTGKSSGKDREQGKATFVSVLGVEGAREEMALAGERSLRALQKFEERADELRDISKKLMLREA